MLAFGADAGPAILARMKGTKEAAWLGEIRKRLSVSARGDAQLRECPKAGRHAE